MMNVENRVFEITSLLAAEVMNVRNLPYEISELKYKALHPEEKENN
ncbi:MAG: hypothetical protein Q8935_10075 [Bacillota bacterium]|nr:hypothetical protein [Bacillota bacterium]